METDTVLAAATSAARFRPVVRLFENLRPHISVVPQDTPSGRDETVFRLLWTGTVIKTNDARREPF